MSARLFLVLTSFIVTLNSLNAASVPFIKKCKPDDAKCTKESSQAALPTYAVGVPEIGVTPLDPLFLPKVDASTAGLKLILTNCTFTGLKGCRIKRMHHIEEQKKIFTKVICDVNLEGMYEMSGQLLILPMEGKGPVHVKLRKILITADIDTEEQVGKDGHKHWDIKSWKHSYELKGKADVEFENLFNGNELLSRTARELIQNNGNDIITEVGTPVIKSVVDSLARNVRRFFRMVPLQDLVDYQ